VLHARPTAGSGILRRTAYGSPKAAGWRLRPLVRSAVGLAGPADPPHETDKPIARVRTATLSPLRLSQILAEASKSE